MQKTEYLKLNKPDSTDFFSVDHQNQNMELIDAELKKQADADGKVNEALAEHIADKNNPHNVTAEGIGITPAAASDIDAILSGSYEEGTDPAEPSDPSDIATDEEIDNIVDNLF